MTVNKLLKELNKLDKYVSKMLHDSRKIKSPKKRAKLRGGMFEEFKTYDRAYTMAEELLKTTSFEDTVREGIITTSNGYDEYKLSLRKKIFPKLESLIITDIAYVPFLESFGEIIPPKGGASEIWNDLIQICNERNLDLLVESVTYDEFGTYLLRKGFELVPGGGITYILKIRT